MSGPDRSRRTDAMRRSFAKDTTFEAMFVEIWRRPRNVGGGPIAEGQPETPIDLNDIAWETGTSQGGVAIKMKYMVKEGLARRTSPRTEQAAWEPTEKLLARYPDGEDPVQPPEETTTTPSGAVVRPASSEEAASWDDDPSLIDMREAVEARLRGKPASESPIGHGTEFEGYLDAPDE